MALTKIPPEMTTGAMQTWTTATRPASPVAGQFGFNSTINDVEFYNGSSWSPIVYTYPIDYLVVAGGGGGSTFNGGTPGSGGAGGGGAGATTSSTGGNGSANTGGGGGGAMLSGGSGGSGIVVIRYPGTQKASGGNSIYSTGGYTYHVFTTSGTLTA